MKALIWICLSPFAVSAFALPAPAKKAVILVDYEYTRDGKEICHGTKEIQSGETYLVCELNRHGNRTFVRLTATVHGPRQYLIQAEDDAISSDGHVTALNRPQIMALDGEASSIEVGERSPQGVETRSMALKITAHGL